MKNPQITQIAQISIRDSGAVGGAGSAAAPEGCLYLESSVQAQNGNLRNL
jgi:hypothetical protein